MIRRIELTNFMSHAHTVIEPAAGLTVLIGPNNVGKSAVVAALQILCRNDNSTYVKRHGCKECSVRIETDDGQTIEWRRKNSPSYLINDQLFDRLREGGLPDELHRALRLPCVDAGGDRDFDVHFGTQKSPIFLLDRSGTVAARFFASSSDAIRLVQMQKRHKDKLADAKAEKKRREEESRLVNAQLEVLAPIVEIDDRLQALERQHGELQQQQQELRDARADLDGLVVSTGELTERQAHAEVLNTLAAPPVLFPVEPLEELIDWLTQAEQDRAESTAYVAALQTLVAPPVMAPADDLELVVSDLDRRQQQAAAASLTWTALQPLPQPPTMHDVVRLDELIDDLTEQTRTVGREQEVGQALSSLSAPPRLTAIDPLRQAVADLDQTREEQARVLQRQQTLQRLADPPDLGDESLLRHQLSAMTAAMRQVSVCKATTKLLEDIAPPPVPAVAELQDFVSDWADAIENQRVLEEAVLTVTSGWNAVREQLREEAAHSRCRVCGGELDPDRVLAQAVSGLGEHAHD